MFHQPPETTHTLLLDLTHVITHCRTVIIIRLILAIRVSNFVDEKPVGTLTLQMDWEVLGSHVMPRY